MRTTTGAVALALLLMFSSASPVDAQDGVTDPLRFDGGSSPSMMRVPTVAELRQQRAWERQRQREARMQANAWAGYHPSRPTVSADPYTVLRYPVYRAGHIWSVWDYIALP